MMGTSSDSLLHVTSIKPKSLQSDDIVVTLTPQTFRYDGTVKKPAIEIIDTVIKTGSKKYGISYSYTCRRAADNPKEAGTYKVYIYSFDANYTGDRYVYFTIEKTKTDAGWQLSVMQAKHTMEQLPWHQDRQLHSPAG